MLHAIARRRAPKRRGLLSSAASAACVCALLLVTGCQPAPRVSAFADTPAQQAAEAKLQAGADAELMPFDEKFYVPPPAAEGVVASAP